MFLNLKRKKFKRQKGLTFIELLVALVINVVMLTALLTIVSQNLNHYTLTIQTNDLSAQLQTALNFMANDIRRAGYWSNARNDIDTGQNNNPFMSGANDITITGGNCIQFTYDRLSTGSLPAISASSDDYRYGFRLVNNTLQTRPSGSNQSCTSAANTWENVTDPKTIRITNLSFTLSSANAPVGATSTYMQIRSVLISITGELISNTAISKTYSMNVKIRNDKFVP